MVTVETMEKTLYLMFAAGVVLAACSREPVAPVETAGEKTFTATVQETKTSAAYDADAKAYSIAWEAGDQVSLFDGAGNRPFTAATAGTATTLRGTAADAAEYYALYPYDASATLDGAVITTTVPSDVAVKADGAGDFANISVAKTSGTTLQFATVAAILKITLGDDVQEVKSLTLTARDGGKVAGSVRLDLSGSQPSLDVVDGVDAITVVPASGETLPGGHSYYFAAVPGTYADGIQVDFLTTDGTTVTKTQDKALTLIAGTVTNLGTVGSLARPDDKLATLETALTSYEWVLASVTCDGVDVTHGAGNSMTLKKDYTFTFDCSSHDGKTYDYYYEQGWLYPDFSNWGEGSYWKGTERWSASVEGGVNYLHFTKITYPLVVVDDVIKNELSYEVRTLDDQVLSVSRGAYVISFTGREITTPDGGTSGTWQHTLAPGDFGVHLDETKEAASLTGTLDGIEWTVTNNVGAWKFFDSWGWAGTVLWNGNHWSSIATEVTLSSSGFPGTLSEVGLDITIGGGRHNVVAVTVGGTSYGAKELNNDDEEHAKQTVTFTGSASGTVVITVTQADASVPIMLRGMSVSYTSGGSGSD